MKHNCVTTYHPAEKIILCLCRFEDAEDNQEFEMDNVNSDWCEDEQERDEQTENGAKNIKLHKNVDDEHKDEESNYNGSGDEDGDNNGDDENKRDEDEDNDDDNHRTRVH